MLLLRCIGLSDEWQQVIQPQSIATIDEYKKATRIGRGTRLNRRQKLEIWQVFEAYRRLLNQHGYKKVHDAYRDAADFIQNNQVDLHYRSIVVDEAQDMGSQAFRLLRAIVPEGKNDLFIVGDALQRIYGQNKVVSGQLGISIRGRSSKLKINYRTTDEIRKYATSVLIDRPVDDLDGGEDDNTLYKSLTHGDAPIHNHFDSAEQQAKFLTDFIKASELDLQNICITARTNNEINKIKTSLETSGIKTFVVNTSESDGPENAVRLATVHRVKGLEFDIVFLVSCNDGLFPLSYAMQNKGDEISYEQAEAEERSLMYVALTRAKKAVYVTSYGSESVFLLNT